jgi:hypothetical protein
LLLLEQGEQEEKVIAMAVPAVSMTSLQLEGAVGAWQQGAAALEAAGVAVAPIKATPEVALEPPSKGMQVATVLAIHQLNGIARIFQAGPNASLALVALVVEAALHKLVPMALLGLTGQAAQAAMASIALPLADT